jgi:putative hydrolase of the HAD superfamily
MSRLRPAWSEIDHALLDLDGTLLDKHFDDYFWEELLPETYAARNGLPIRDARDRLLEAYRAEEGSLNWTDIDFWSERLRLDLRTLKEEIAHMVRLHPDAEPFLDFLRKEEKKVYVITNAHPKTVELKLPRTVLPGYLDGLLCAAEVGRAKEQEGFWERAQERIGFDPERTLFIDDNEAVLLAARKFGILHLFFRGLSSSRAPAKRSSLFPTLDRLDLLIGC